MPSPVSYKVIEGTKSRTCMDQNYPGCFLCSAPLISPPTTWGASLFSSHLRKRGLWEVRRPAHGHMLNVPHLGFEPSPSDTKPTFSLLEKVAPNKEANTGKCESNFWKCPGSSWKARPPALALLRNLDACQPLVSVNYCLRCPVTKSPVKISCRSILRNIWKGLNLTSNPGNAIKTTPRMHFIPIRLAKKLKSDNIKFEQRYRIMRTLKHYWRGLWILFQVNLKTHNSTLRSIP